ncbi:MAG: hypothetical protein AUK47_09750 [Deltaproteobacteria bacterium CG2_30_63_29]|nr:MAG: hypothetical protein AUK47_09750 [Deltaproteobacteria bacterium CG2_30_63_29]PJB40568.1 MAG: pyridoxal phosphate-dependent aminotransferase [Deltaproteobacteria bacterium CG_4_9_14_3_um_filter_63_12]
MPFSTRVPAYTDLRPNPLTAALHERLAEGLEVLDLTRTNPTTTGFATASADWSTLTDAHLYQPTALGSADARQAVVDYYVSRGSVAPEAEHVVLCASTSEAYGFLVKLLCEPGDVVLTPSPSYPLLDSLLGLEAVRQVPFPLIYDGLWHIDFDALVPHLQAARALVLVAPNNPTGHLTTPSDLTQVLELCAEHGVAIISDEVFSDFLFEPTSHAIPLATRPSDALVFSLNGLSKVCGLPQVKLSWIVLGGPPPLRADALERLEYIADTYLSVSTPAQLLLPKLLAERHGFQEALGHRLRSNKNRAREILAGSTCSPLQVQGGWSLPIRIPNVRSDEAIALALLRERGVFVHPGSFYGFGCAVAHLVVSLMCPEDEFAAGLEQVRCALADT